jgi:ACS family allantoate permease-like MFS transporter
LWERASDVFLLTFSVLMMDPLQAPSGRSSSEADKHAHGIAVATKDVDTGAALIAGMSGDLDPDDAARVRYVCSSGLIN